MIKYIPAGDSAFLLKFSNVISEETNSEIRAFTYLLSKKKIKGVIDLIPSYCDLLVIYDPLKIEYQKLIKALKKLELKANTTQLPPSKTIRIPVLYSQRFGTDIDFVSKYTGLTLNEIIELHTEKKYLIFMLGFTPGFCYLGGMNSKLITPRKNNPSLKILSGSVGIADSQTGIYPIESPGGWQIIGRTPIKLIDFEKNNPFYFQAGDYLEFFSITDSEYDGYNKNN